MQRPGSAALVLSACCLPACCRTISATASGGGKQLTIERLERDRKGRERERGGEGGEGGEGEGEERRIGGGEGRRRRKIDLLKAQGYRVISGLLISLIETPHQA